MSERTRVIAAVAMTMIVAIPTLAAAQNRGVQFTPDGKRILVNKDVGTERWAITKNENGSLTGNVFRSDGGPPAFVFCVPAKSANNFDCFGADACTDSGDAERGVQRAPDSSRVLAQKDVGAERWAMSLNADDGTATGNVFRADGGDPAFVVCAPTEAPGTFDCSGADKCQGTPCTEAFTPIATVTLPDDFFAIPEPCGEVFADIGNVDIPPSFFEPVVTVAFEVNASAPVQGLLLRVTYPTGKGSFPGSGDLVSCTSDGSGVFVANDTDVGELILVVGALEPLRLPFSVRCGFNATEAIVPSDFLVQVQEVTQNDVPGDPSVLTVGVVVR